MCLAVLVGWYGALRRGAVRVAGLSAGAIAFAAAILLLVDERVLEVALIVGGFVVAGALARVAVSRAGAPRARSRRPDTRS